MKAEMTFYVKEKTQPETRCCTFDGTQKGLGEMIGSILTDPSFRPDNILTVKAAGEICRVNTAKRGTRTLNGDKLAQFHITGVSNAIPVSPSHLEERELRCINPKGNNYKKYFIIPEAGGIRGAYGSIDVLKDKCRRTKDLYPDPLYDENDERILALKHMVASHHGTLEWEAIKIPGLAEAMFLHFLDNLDAKMYVFEKSDENTETGTMDDGRRPMGARAWHAPFHAVKET